MQKEGIIVKGIAGFYYVELNKEGNRIVECKARGKFRNVNQTPIVGDRVIITLSDQSADDSKGVIDEILPRKSQLIRPLVANVDQAFIVFALRKPDINLMLLDKLLILAEHNGLDAIICLNKSDLDDNNLFDEISMDYCKIGYQVIRTNGRTGDGIEQLRLHLKDRISVFVGPSGVGKSTIFNEIQDKVKMKTGEISDKVDRGKHTTRHAELIEVMNGAFVVDTPGFSSMELDFMKPEELPYTFREFREHLDSCKFTSCMHNKEIGCAVKEAVENGSISQHRYETYISILENLQQQNSFRRNKR